MAGSGSVVRALVALMAVTVGVLTPAPAMAADPVWHRAACFSGTVDTVEVTERGQAFLRIQGHLDCAVQDKAARFGYARYDLASEWGQVRAGDLRRYRAGEPTPFAEGRYVAEGPADFAVCVVTDYDAPVDCVRVYRADPASALDVAPLPRKDATYSRPVRFADGDYRPACGGCW
ncbi:hypothetical protein RB614_05600 [Phytohabitans sp. ZYX-F-186]|uniref:Uncharacterized protein n=1 Tax=Phytohabitans maris TaxID=3071409 RepID=A0ABU0ZCE8_9ACTN|nr:hypothetical protein [Phytohabitans sp. ZYX-F-186]MDQ7903995.1 hypothetical protein [Phytohabitans sp. ZYX-F-186]